MNDTAGHGPDPKDNQPAGNQVEILFEHREREIRLLFSLYSGREQVYVDDQLVSDHRSWRFRNQHRFEAGGVRYVLEVHTKKSARNILFGIIDVRLLADGVLIDSDQFNGARYVLNQLHTRPGWLLLLPYTLAGGIIGSAVAYYALNHFL
ncbi:hypothetical protein AOT14_20520 [Stenotrophomonas acidaminiphila]|uniref:Transmembrane protein n=1 Tax=Stenotrophomonas acidaminiphila TaxID=128780 RepID=A0A0S1B0E8_9GAMM|nr:hypothetical protein [Stenotrophomonas acidaminiphila]ALJ28427.1 hypothetical protein AOT14_20520 [Stenotrophomonas acidaminiphila]